MNEKIPKKFSLAEQKEKYKNAYAPWTGEDDFKLETLRLEGKSTAELALIFERNRGAIHSRLKKFGLERLR